MYDVRVIKNRAMIIVEENRQYDQSLNPGNGCMHFTKH